MYFERAMQASMYFPTLCQNWLQGHSIFYVWHIAIFLVIFFYKNNPDGQQPIKEPSLKYYPFPLLSVSSLIRDHNIFLVGVFSVCFLL